MNQVSLDAAIFELREFVGQANAFRTMLILIGLIIASYILSKYLARGIIRFAQFIALKADNTPNEERQIKYRQIETYLSIAVAVVRALVVALAAYIGFRILSPIEEPSGLAAIGAGTFFIVFAGQTIGMMLRDLTAGTLMISEGWFTVGDFIKVEPFMDVSGVVERFTLRSTKIRSLSGEVVWIHNQQMAAVHVTPRGVRTIAVDVFTANVQEGRRAIENIIHTIPTGPTLLAKPIRFTREEKWGEDLYRITVSGQTTPGREWLIEKFLVNAIIAIDKDKPESQRLFTYEPIARYADPVTERKFRRAVRARSDS
ncbi:mechanosensitive ion channel family protein [Candidatus Saccharibacteria bacterium]|nr:mechanosensitive ion channel family protein [Candidatus Saccharibacteria bacterium]